MAVLTYFIFSTNFFQPAAMEALEDYENYTYDYYMDGDGEGLLTDGDEVSVDYRQRETMHIISVVMYIASFVLGVIGNGTVIWVTAFKSKRTVNSIWLLNLALADFVFVLFLPLYVDYILRDFHWDFGRAMCKLNSFVSAMNMYASVLFVTVLSVDRYVSLVHLDWSRRYRRVGGAWATCGCVWMLAAALSCPALVFRETIRLHDKVVCFNNYHADDRHAAAVRHIAIVAVRTTVGFLLPLTAIAVTAILLTVRVNRSRGLVRLSSFSKTVSAVILAFFLCWAPFHTFSLMELTVHSSLHLHHVLQMGFPLATSFGFFNSCINPLLYVLLGKKIRRILKRACFDLRSSLRDLSQSISATDVESAPGAHQHSVPEEPLECSAL